MRNKFAFALMALTISSAAQAQSGGCHTPTEESTHGTGWLVALVTSNAASDSLFRRNLHVTARSAADVSLITSDSVCTAAAAAMAADKGVPYDSVAVYVYKVGTVYVVDEHWGTAGAGSLGYRPMYFLDSAFKVLSVGGR